jgi:uncharacterized membrane protein
MKSTLFILFGFISLVLAVFMCIVTFTHESYFISAITGLGTVVFTICGVFLMVGALTILKDTKDLHEFEEHNEDIYRNCLK